MGLELALGIVGIVGHERIRHLAACRENGILPFVVVLLVGILSHPKSSRQTAVHEDGLYQRCNGRGQNLTGIHDSHAATVGIGTSGTDGKTGIELCTCGVHIVEAACKLHLGSVHVGTVFQKLDAHACREFLGQFLIGKLSALNGLSGLSDEQRKRVLHFTNLALDVFGLCQHAVVAGLGTLHAGGAIASQLHLQFHHVPGILGQSGHVVDNLQLAVEHQQRVIHIGNARHDLGLHHRLIVFRGKECHLCRTLLVEDVTEEIGRPRCVQRQRINLRCLTEVP